MPRGAAYALIVATPLALLIAGMLRHVGLNWHASAGTTACLLVLFVVATCAPPRGSPTHDRAVWRAALALNATAALLLWALIATRLPAP